MSKKAEKREFTHQLGKLKDELEVLRKYKGITHKELVEKAGVSRTQYYEFRRLVFNPPIAFLVKVFRAVDHDVKFTLEDK